MIVEPDFLDHWKTRLLVNELADELGPLYVIRLWSHCQMRRAHKLKNVSAQALKAICRFPGDHDKFEAALSLATFVKREDDAIIVCGWKEKNAKLLANWVNGKRGGRKKKEEPNANPPGTQTEPNGNPTPSSVRRGSPDKSREEKNKYKKKTAQNFTAGKPAAIEQIKDKIRKELEAQGVNI